MQDRAIQNRLSKALYPCLRLLARMLLRSGVGYSKFSELAKKAFVQEAIDLCDPKGRSANVSRISVRTGLSRKDVARIRQLIDQTEVSELFQEDVSSQSGNAARVLQLWHSDPRFLGGSGEPMDLSLASDDEGFGALVRIAGGDVPPGAVRAELSEAGAVIETETGALRPVKRHFVPANVGEDLLVGLTHFVTPLLAGLARNTAEPSEGTFIQRLSFTERLLPESVPIFRDHAECRVEEFVRSIDDWLGSRELPPEVDLSTRTRVGVGVFYFEGLRVSRSKLKPEAGDQEAP
jgi:hypothetical protein